MYGLAILIQAFLPAEVWRQIEDYRLRPKAAKMTTNGSPVKFKVSKPLLGQRIACAFNDAING